MEKSFQNSSLKTAIKLMLSSWIDDIRNCLSVFTHKEMKIVARVGMQ